MWKNLPILTYIEPHRVIIKNITFLIFNHSNDVYITNLTEKIKLSELEEYLKEYKKTDYTIVLINAIKTQAEGIIFSEFDLCIKDCSKWVESKTIHFEIIMPIMYDEYSSNMLHIFKIFSLFLVLPAIKNL